MKGRSLCIRKTQSLHFYVMQTSCLWTNKKINSSFFQFALEKYYLCEVPRVIIVLLSNYEKPTVLLKKSLYVRCFHVIPQNGPSRKLDTVYGGRLTLAFFPSKPLFYWWIIIDLTFFLSLTVVSTLKPTDSFFFSSSLIEVSLLQKSDINLDGLVVYYAHANF